MGDGFFHDGKFDLNVFVRFSASATVLTEWQRSFARASAILFHATGGQMRFGSIYVTNDSGPAPSADAYLFEPPGRSGTAYTVSCGSGDVFNPQVMNLQGDERFHPFVIVHEFGHYGFGLKDEYKNQGGGVSHCTGDPGTHACIMEFRAADGDELHSSGTLTVRLVNQFCNSLLHDATIANVQQECHGESCWETIVRRYPDFVEPTIAGTMSSGNPASHPLPNWTIVSGMRKVVLILDNGALPQNSILFQAMLSGANFLVDYGTVTRTQLTILSSSGHVVLPPTELLGPAVSTAAHQAIEQFASYPDGDANWLGMLGAASAAMGTTERSAFQSVVLVTGDGPSFVVDDTRQIALGLQQAGVRWHTLAFAGGDALSPLQQLSNQTHGTFKSVRLTEDLDATGFQLQKQLIQQAVELHCESDVVLQHTTPDKAPAVQAGGSLFSHEFWVEAQSARVTIAVSMPDVSSVSLTLGTPTDRQITLNAADGSRAIAGGISISTADSYLVVSLPRPESGRWTIELTTKTRLDTPSLFLMATSQSPHIEIRFNVQQSRLPNFATFFIASVWWDTPLTDLETPKIEIASLDDPQATVRQLELQPETWVDDGGKPREVGSGQYVGQLGLPPGSYVCRAIFENKGQARPSPEFVDDDQSAAIPPFVRVVERQFRVGD